MFDPKYKLGEEVNVMYHTAEIIGISRFIDDREKYFYTIRYENSVETRIVEKLEEEVLDALN